MIAIITSLEEGAKCRVCMWFNDRLHPLFTHEVEKNKRIMLQLHYSLDAERERAGTKTCERIRNNGTA